MAGLTNFPNGASSFGIPLLGSAAIPFTGAYYFVNENTGLDGNTGTSPSQALKTLDRALVLESAVTNGAGGRNSVVYFSGTQHRTSTLAWNLPQTHLIGICAPMRRGKRARISVTGSVAFDKLVDVSQQGCYFANFGTFYGFNDASANICWYDEAGRSCYDNIEFMGFGDGTATTGTANHTAARAFTFTNSGGETLWRNCVFGVDTIQRGAANYTLEIAGGAPRLYFENCDFEADLAAGGTASSHVLIGAAGIDRYVNFTGCRFHSDVDSSGSAMAQGFNVSGSAGGSVILDQSTFNGITAIQTTPTANMRMNMVASTTTGGLTHVVF